MSHYWKNKNFYQKKAQQKAKSTRGDYCEQFGIDMESLKAAMAAPYPG